MDTMQDLEPVPATIRYGACVRCGRPLPVIGGPLLDAMSDDELAAWIDRIAPRCRACQEAEEAKEE